MNKMLFSGFFILYCMNVLCQERIEIRIDPSNARGGVVSNIFDSIKFTPLETTKESVFGSVDQLVVTDSFFIVLDIRGRSVLLFKRDGKFFVRIKSGGSEKMFNYFTVDKINNYIYITNNFAKGVLKYDFSGTLISVEDTPKEVQSIYIFPSGVVLYNFFRPFDLNAKPENAFDLGFSKGFKKITKYLNPYDFKKESSEYNMPKNPLNGSGKSVFFTLPFYYTVYELNEKGVVRFYDFKLPLNMSLPDGFSTDQKFRGKRAKYVYSDEENYGKKYGIQSVNRVQDYLLFSLVSTEKNIGLDWNYLYSLKTKSLVSFSKVSGDSSTGYIPLLGSVFEDVNCVHNNKIFSSYPAFRIFGISKELKKEGVVYPEGLRKFISNGNKNDNPVIVEFVTKKGL